MPSVSSYRELNYELFDQLGSDDPALVKNAQSAVTSFVRTQVREDGIYRKVIPMTPVTADDLDQQVWTDKPTIVCEIEPGSPGAISMPFATTPIGWYLQTAKFAVTSDRITTPRFVKDLSELRTYRMDIRQVISDNALRDVLAHEDSRFFTAMNAAMGGVQGGVSPMSGSVQWQLTVGGITRDTIAEDKKILPSTPYHLEPVTAIVNNVTVNEFVKWAHDESGGQNISADMLMKGTIIENMFGLTWVVTNKRHLCPDDTIFYLSDPRTIGKSFIFEDITLGIKRENFMIEWFSYEELGGAIAHAAGIGRADHV